MPQSYTKLLYHIVFSTKDRTPLIHDGITNRLYPYIRSLYHQRGGSVLAINGTDDHLHTLAQLRQDRAVSDVIRDIKAVSSGWMHKNGERSFGWQKGYGGFTVSHSQRGQAQAYIENQRLHHRKRAFQAEFEMLLRAHGIDFDERYLWV